MKIIKILPLIGIILFSTGCDLPFLTKADDDQKYELNHDYNGIYLTSATPIVLSWSEVTIESFKEFIIERAYIDTRGTHWIVIDSLKDSLAISYTDTIKDDKTFQYRIRIVNQADQYYHISAEPFTVPEVFYVNVPGDYDAIQSAYDNSFIDPGDSIIVGPGEYVVNLNLRGKNVTITSSAGPSLTELRSAGGFHSTVVIDKGHLKGFRITNGNTYIGGGGIHAKGQAIISNCTIRNNRSIIDPDSKRYVFPMANGGGIFATDSVVIRKCSIIDNYSQTGGGGLAISGNASVINCNISENTDANTGGGLLVYKSSGLIRNCNFLHNTVPKGRGGGIVLKDGVFEIYNCVINLNFAESGAGGIVCFPTAELLVVNCVVYGNLLAFLGTDYGAINQEADYTIRNSIFWENSGICDRKLMSQKSFFSNIEGITPYYINDNIDEDPLFVDPTIGDFHLSSSSPCINIGDPGVDYNDQDGSRNDLGVYGGPYGSGFNR